MVQQCQPGFVFDEKLGRCIRPRTDQQRQRTQKISRKALAGQQLRQGRQQRAVEKEQQTAIRSTQIQFSGQKRVPDTFQDIASNILRQEQQKISDPQGRFPNLPRTTSFDFGGRIFSIDAEGNLTDIGAGRTQVGGTKIIGISDTGRRTNLGRSTTSQVDPETGQIITTAGRAPIGTFQRESGGQGIGTIGPGQEELAASFQRGGRDPGTVPTGLEGELSGVEKQIKLTEAGLLGGLSRGATKTIAQIGEIDFAKQFGIFTRNAPKPAPGEDPRDFAVKIANWKVENITKAFNKSMQNWEQQKIIDAIQKQQEAFTTPGFSFKSKNQIQKELENDNNLNSAFNQAVTRFESDRKALTEANIKKRTARLGTGSEKSRELATKAIEAEERQKEKEDIAIGLADLEKQKAERIESITDQQFTTEGSLQAEIKRKEGLTLDERAAEEKADFIENKTEDLMANDPSLTLNSAIAQAKKIFKGDEGKPPSIKEISSDLDDIILAEGFDKNTSFGVAVSAFGNDLTEASEYMERRGFTKSDIIRQKEEYQVDVLGFDQEQIDASKKGQAKVQQQTSFLAGNIKIGDLGTFLDNAEASKNPKDYQKMLDIALTSGNLDANSEELVRNRKTISELRSGKSAKAAGKFDFDVLPLEAQEAVLRVGKLAFGTRISDKEGERILSIVSNPENKGKSVFDISTSILGFKPRANIKLGENLVSKLSQSLGRDEGLSVFPLDALSKFLTDGNKKAAINLVEKLVTERAKEVEGGDFIAESFIKRGVQKVNEVEKLINAAKSADEDLDIGNFTGTVENWLGRFKGTKEAEIKAKIVSAIAEMRNKLLGSAVTPTEERFLEPLIPELSDRIPVLLNKLAAIKSQGLTDLNSIRTTFGLPEINEEQLLDIEKRIPLYEEGITELGATRPTGETDIFSLTASVEGTPTSHSQDQDFQGNTFASHGSFQMNREAATKFAQLMEFSNTDPESPEFIAEWDRLASEPDFVENERNFIKLTHFDPQIQKLTNAKLPQFIINDKRFQQLVLDVAVNSGPNTDIIIQALKGKSFGSIDDVIRLITEERSRRAKGTPLEVGLNKRFQTVATALS